jgi:hypothetical protein
LFKFAQKIQQGSISMEDLFTHLDRSANDANNSNKDQHTIDLESSSNSNANQSTSKVRNVRLIYCSDGVVEQCDEDDEEQARLEEEEKQRVIEERKRMDLEAVRIYAWIYFSIQLDLNLIEEKYEMGPMDSLHDKKGGYS